MGDSVVLNYWTVGNYRNYAVNTTTNRNVCTTISSINNLVYKGREKRLLVKGGGESDGGVKTEDYLKADFISKFKGTGGGGAVTLQ